MSMLSVLAGFTITKMSLLVLGPIMFGNGVKGIRDFLRSKHLLAQTMDCVRKKANIQKFHWLLCRSELKCCR